MEVPIVMAGACTVKSFFEQPGVTPALPVSSHVRVTTATNIQSELSCICALSSVSVKHISLSDGILDRQGAGCAAEFLTNVNSC